MATGSVNGLCLLARMGHASRRNKYFTIECGLLKAAWSEDGDGIIQLPAGAITQGNVSPVVAACFRGGASELLHGW